MKIRISDDAEEIRGILTHPDIYAVISSDLAPPAQHYIVDMNEKVFLVGYVDEKPIGVMIFYPCGDVACWCHIQVLPEYRKEHAFAFGKMAVQWAWDSLAIAKLVAQIPAIYPNVIRFAEMHDFEIEGINKRSYLKDGQLIDQYYLGLARP